MKLGRNIPAIFELAALTLSVGCDDIGTSPRYRVAYVRMDSAPCGKSPGEVAEMVQAAKEGNVAGYASLGQRDGNMLLDKGTKVEVLGEYPEYNMSSVFVDFGVNRGKSCFIPTRGLTESLADLSNP